MHWPTHDEYDDEKFDLRFVADPSDWRHIPGEYHIADKISRGFRVQDLQGSWKDSAIGWDMVGSHETSSVKLIFQC